jgi:hypothetical protein
MKEALLFLQLYSYETPPQLPRQPQATYEVPDCYQQLIVDEYDTYHHSHWFCPDKHTIPMNQRYGLELLPEVIHD